MIDFPLPQINQRFASLKTGQSFYGAPVGILQFEWARSPGIRPCIPGSVGNASTWSVPVRYKTVSVLHNVAEMTSAVTQSATELVREGAQLITSNCGFMIRYQDAVRAAVDVPVLLSSLLLAPFLERMLPREKVLGIITARASSLTPDLFEAAGLPANTERVAVAGLENAPAFAAAFLDLRGDLDVSAVETETVDAAVALLNDRPDVGMLLLTCSELPPYAAAVQRAIGIPVFDYTSMVEFFIEGLIRRPFNGLA
ncbi:AroM protein [Bradyrhizobium shewense]|uniref:AroM protein n=1 Tax=Bradyrhizobium shewense TaxID=1761772 RepID=A0A1C3XV77_9BRAD|nr:AroM protein [Bradyrhizobium shewense]